MANSDKEVDWGESSESIQQELIFYKINQGSRDAALRRFKEYSLFFIGLLIAISLYSTCLFLFIKNPNDGWLRTVVVSFAMSFVAYLTGKRAG